MKRFVVLAVLATAAAAFAQPTKNFTVNPNIPIPDGAPGNNIPGAPAVATINVPADAGGLNTITDLNVDMVITHTFQGDIVVTLTPPVATGVGPITLMNRPGVPQTPFGFGNDNYGTLATPFIFDDEAANIYDIPAVAAPGITNVGGNWKPESALSVLDGKSKVGIWTLSVTDNAGFDIGTLNQFSLHFTQVPEPASLSLLGLGAMGLIRRRR